MLRDKILQSKTNTLIIQAFNKGMKVGRREVVESLKENGIEPTKAKLKDWGMEDV